MRGFCSMNSDPICEFFRQFFDLHLDKRTSPKGCNALMAHFATKKLKSVVANGGNYPPLHTIEESSLKMSSKIAKELLETKFKDARIVDMFETLDHDGYDCDGPESNLWDLHMIVLEETGYIYYRFHCEDWFHSRTIAYELEYKATVESIYNAGQNTKQGAYCKPYLETMGMEDEAYCEYLAIIKKKKD